MLRKALTWQSKQNSDCALHMEIPNLIRVWPLGSPGPRGIGGVSFYCSQQAISPLIVWVAWATIPGSKGVSVAQARKILTDLLGVACFHPSRLEEACLETNQTFAYSESSCGQCVRSEVSWVSYPAGYTRTCYCTHPASGGWNWSSRQEHEV